MQVNSSTMNFADVVAKYLREYETEATEKLTETITEVAKESVKKLRSSSPKRTGKYAKGWTYKVEKGRMNNVATVYGNAPTYRMAHLLENGHAKRGGGRTAPITHIEPVEQWAVDNVVNRYIEKMER